MRNTNARSSLLDRAVLVLTALLLIACDAARTEPPPIVSVPTSSATAARPAGADFTSEVGKTAHAPAATLQPTAHPTPTPRAVGTPPNPDGLPTIHYNGLPPEAHTTIALIDAGGPFPYRQDGNVFQNRERILPRRPGGYYHEYTVETPGEDDRGARRIVTGEEGELYYTDDHYASFRRVVR